MGAARIDAEGAWGWAEIVGMPLSAKAGGRLERQKDVTVLAPADPGGRKRGSIAQGKET